MKFFVPDVASAHAEFVYTSLLNDAKSQMKTAISTRRIYSLKYFHEKREWSLAVGDLHPEHLGYVVLIILESKPYIVLAKSLRGAGGHLTILVNDSEVTTISDFE